MQSVVALFVDSWQWREEGNFALFQVCLRGEDNSQWQVARRYSEFYRFHYQIVCQELGIVNEQIAKLSELFPGKSFLSRQSESFLNTRARALDAYLQLLKHFFGRRNWNHPEVVDFFQIPEPKQTPAGVQKLSTPGPEEFKNLMAKAERLFHALKGDGQFASELDAVVKQLSELVAEKGFRGDQRRFYDLKREIELFRIKNNLLSREMQESFSLPQAAQNFERPEAKVHRSTALLEPEEKEQEQKNQLRFQDAILKDLESTVLEQKHLSMALAEEIDAQNRFLSELQSKQDGTVENFEKSSSRVQKLK